MKALVFSTSWCGPCKAYKTSIRAAQEQGCEISVVDAEKDQAAVELYGIRSVPTTILLADNDEVIVVIAGPLSTEKLLALFGKKA